MSRYLPALTLLLVLVGTASAQGPARDLVEIGGSSHTYDAGIASWQAAVVRAQFNRGPRMVWLAEAVAEHRFNEPSFAYKIQHSGDYGAWISRIAGRTSNGGFYNPRYRFDAMIGRKLPPRRKIILMVGGFYREVRDGHQDAAAIVETQVYLTRWLIAQASVRYQVSNPGGATSVYQDVALTLGRPGKATVVLHGASGTEAYQIIDPLVIYTDFTSQMGRVAYRQWLTRTAGIALTGSYYSNPFYRRTGFEVSLFFGFNSAGP